MVKPRRRGLDGVITFVGVLFLLIAIWFLFLGIGVVACFETESPLVIMTDEAYVVSQVVMAVLYIGFGIGFVAIAWWLAGLPIRRWWWRRTGQTGEAPPVRSSGE